MTRDYAQRMLPIMQAYVDGKILKCAGKVVTELSFAYQPEEFEIVAPPLEGWVVKFANGAYSFYPFYPYQPWEGDDTVERIVKVQEVLE